MYASYITRIINDITTENYEEISEEEKALYDFSNPYFDVISEYTNGKYIIKK